MLHKNYLLALMLWIFLFSLAFSTIFEVEKTRGIPYQISENAKAGSARYSVRVDKRIELLTAVQLLINWTQIGMPSPIWSGSYLYKRDMLDFLGPWSNHTAVDLCRKLAIHGFNMDAPVSFMMYLSDPPDLKIITPFSDYHVMRAEWVCPGCGISILEEFVDALKDFYLESKFEEFWNSHKVFYDNTEKRATADIPLQNTVETLQDYFGISQHEYHVILAPLFFGFYGGWVRTNNSSDVFAFLGPQKIENNIPVFGVALWHEFAHSFVNPLTDEFLEEYRKPLRLFEPIKEEMSSMAYGEWATMINEHILRAVEIREFGTLQLSQEEVKGFIYIRPLFDLLSKYDRDSYGSFREFYPEIVNLFNVIADEYNLTVNVVDTRGEDLSNVLVSLSLPNGKEATSKSTNSTGYVVFEKMLNITYPMEASLQGYKNQAMEITFRSKDQIETITLPSIPFIETPLGLATMYGGTIVLTSTILIILRRRKT